MILTIDRQLLQESTRLILENYREFFRRDLMPSKDSSGAVEALFNSPRVVLYAVGTIGSDHIFSYANFAALTLFETSWDKLIGQPSSESAEPVHREERRDFLDEVSRRGFIENYTGIQISQKGRRFRILDATVFNVLGSEGSYLGQCATFTDWESV